MDRFRSDNTEGYDADDLAALNAAWQDITSHGASALDPDDLAVQSMLNHWEACLLAEFDTGKRGADLVAWFMTIARTKTR